MKCSSHEHKTCPAAAERATSGVGCLGLEPAMRKLPQCCQLSSPKTRFEYPVQQNNEIKLELPAAGRRRSQAVRPGADAVPLHAYAYIRACTAAAPISIQPLGAMQHLVSLASLSSCTRNSKSAYGKGAGQPSTVLSKMGPIPMLQVEFLYYYLRMSIFQRQSYLSTACKH